MKRGTTNKPTTGNFGEVRGAVFDIPEGTRVVYGAPDCDGNPFPHWTLPEHTARALSGNEHDSRHRFVSIHADHVTPDADGPGEYGLFVAWRPYRCDCCGALNEVSTNHTGPVRHSCPKCSWRMGRDSDGRLYRADIGKERPHYYAGQPPCDHERNPHARHKVGA